MARGRPPPPGKGPPPGVGFPPGVGRGQRGPLLGAASLWGGGGRGENRPRPARGVRFADTTVSPIFLPRLPLMKPRTEWACQLVAFMISASVAPLGRFNRSMIFAALLPSRADPAFFAALGAFLAALAFGPSWPFWAQRARALGQRGPSCRVSASRRQSPGRCRFLR